MNKYIIKSYDELNENLLEAWKLLWEKSENASYINGPQWFLSVRETFNYRKVTIVVIYQNTQIVAIVGLFKTNLYGIDVYTIPPGDFVSGIPFLTSGINSKKVIEIMIGEITKMGTLVLENVPDYFVDNFNIARLYKKFIPQALNFYLNIKRDLGGQVIVHGRKKLIKEARKIEQDYEIRSFNGNNKKMLALVFKIDIKSKKHINAYNTFSDVKIKRLYETFARNFGENLLISILYFRGRAVAYEIGFKVKNTYTGSQVAYDNRYSKFTPGKVSELKVIDLIASKGVSCIDYGSGDSYIKRLICYEYRHLYKIIIGDKSLLVQYLQLVLIIKRSLYLAISKNQAVYLSYRKVIRKFFTRN